jgi:hypothetical protein
MQSPGKTLNPGASPLIPIPCTAVSAESSEVQEGKPAGAENPPHLNPS